MIIMLLCLSPKFFLIFWRPHDYLGWTVYLCMNWTLKTCELVSINSNGLVLWIIWCCLSSKPCVSCILWLFKNKLYVFFFKTYASSLSRCPKQQNSKTAETDSSYLPGKKCSKLQQGDSPARGNIPRMEAWNWLIHEFPRRGFSPPG